MIIFLDDSEGRIKTFLSRYPSALIARTSWEVIKLLEDAPSPIQTLFLDHDLGGEELVNPSRENTGSDVVRWIVENKPAIYEIFVHSHNRPAAERMEANLREAGYRVMRIPWINLRSHLLS